VDRVVPIHTDNAYSKERRVERTMNLIKYRLQKMAEAEAAQGGKA